MKVSNLKRQLFHYLFVVEKASVYSQLTLLQAMQKVSHWLLPLCEPGCNKNLTLINVLQEFKSLNRRVMIFKHVAESLGILSLYSYTRNKQKKAIKFLSIHMDL